MNEMKKVRAKFTCDKIVKYESTQEVHFYPVIGNEGENKDFTDATPWGALNMGISGDVPTWIEFFTPGKNYYLDFTEAK